MRSREQLEGLPLTPSEVRVLELLADGYTQEFVARRFDVPVSTLRGWVVIVQRKLGARNSTHAVKLGFVKGYLRVPSPEVA
jgi:DNA-binding NarL/FixJ family response regulator